MSHTKRTRPQWYRDLLAQVKRRALGCHYCGAPATTLDHVIELQQGGSNTRDNLVPACQACNSRKGSQTYQALRHTGGHTPPTRRPKRWRRE